MDTAGTGDRHPHFVGQRHQQNLRFDQAAEFFLKVY
jgi:hypothetical protein